MLKAPVSGNGRAAVQPVALAARTAAQAPGLSRALAEPPRVRPGSVRRTALLHRLLAASQDVVSVVAPPGYGKTTLLAQWAALDERTLAWVPLRDPGALAAFLAVEVERAGVLGAAGAPFQVPEHATWLTVVLGLRDALASATRPALLVIDDAHLLRGTELTEAVAALAERLPAGSQLVLSGRTSAEGVPIARLRAQGRLLEIGATDLRLSARESAALLRGAGVRLPRARVSRLAERTEGWPAGLYLGALAARDEGAADDGGPGFGGLDRYVTDYLRLEILAGLGPSDLRFLTRTAVLERLGGPLCDALLERTGSARRLERLEQQGLPVVPLDRNRRWYRHHGLFRELLEAELVAGEPALVPVLHRRAAAWLEASGDDEAALVHAEAAGDAEHAACLLERLLLPAYHAGRAAAVEGQLSRLEADGAVHRRHPALAVAGAWVHAFSGRAVEAERWVRAAFTAPRRKPDPAAAALLQAALCGEGLAQMRADVEAGLGQAVSRDGWWPTALFLLGVTHLLASDLERADLAFAEAEQAAPIVGATDTYAAALAERSLVAVEHGEWEQAEELAARAEAAVRDAGLESYATTALLHAAVARLALRRGDRDRASSALAEAASLLPRLTYAVPWLAVQARLELARAHLASGEPDRARTRCREIGDVLARRPQLGSLADQAAALRHQVAVHDGAWATTLTAAELRLLPLLATHLSFREIAGRLYVSRNTVKTQAISTYRKLGVSSRSDAIDEAARLGLIEAPAVPSAAGHRLDPAHSA